MAPVDPGRVTLLLFHVHKWEALDTTKLFASIATGYSGEMY